MSAYETKEEDEEVLRAVAASMESMKDSSVIASNKKDIASNDKDDASTAKGEEKCSTKTLTYPPLPEEPSGDKSLLCRVGIRLPDGRRVQRNFLKTDPIRVRTLFYLYFGYPFCLCIRYLLLSICLESICLVTRFQVHNLLNRY